MKTSISVVNLQMAYQQKVVVKALSVDFPVGHIIGIIGPNGSGKTTFLKGLLELIPRQSGTVAFFGKSLNDIRSQLAYVPQRESVDWDFPASVRDVVAMGRLNPKKWWQRLSKADHAIIDSAIEQVNLVALKEQQIGQLSGGQQQRVFLARALAQEADLIVMDEPFVGIDMVSQDAILNVLHTLRNEGKTIVMVHHDLSAVAAHFDDVLLLNNEFVAFGPTSEVLIPDVLSKAYGTSFLFQSKEN